MIKKRIPRGSILVILVLCLIGIWLASTPLPCQQEDRVKDEIFQEADQLINKANAEEVPFLAPSSFAKGMEFYRKALAKYQKGAKIKNIQKDLEQAQNYFMQSFQKAKETRKALEEVLDLRNLVRSKKFSSKAPKQFSKAESQIQQAIKDVEKNDLSSARRKGMEAKYLYQKTVMDAYRDVIIKEAQNRLESKKSEIPRDQFKKSINSLKGAGLWIKNQEKKAVEIEDFIRTVDKRIQASVDIVGADLEKSAPPDEVKLEMREAEIVPVITLDADNDGLSDVVENGLLQRFSPFYKFSYDDTLTAVFHAPGSEPYRPTDAIWYIKHSDLIKYADETEAPEVFDRDVLRLAPSRILEANIEGEDWGPSDITENQKKTKYCLNIHNPYRDGFESEDGFDWPEVMRLGNIGLYGHVVPYGQYCKIEYYQFFGYNSSTQNSNIGDHEGDWCTVQLIYSPETDRIVRVLHYAHGKEMSFDTSLTNDELTFDADGDGIFEIKELRGPNYDTSDIDIANSGQQWMAYNNVVRFYRDPVTGDYTHPIVYIENSSHEFWPSPYWTYKTYVAGIGFESPSHAGGDTYRGMPKQYLTRSVPNMGEVEYPLSEETEIIMRYNGKWGAYNIYNPNPPGPALHWEWTWPLTSSLRRSAPGNIFEDGSSMGRHWPAVVETLATFVYSRIGLAVGDVDGDGAGEIIQGDGSNNRITIYNSTGRVKYEAAQEIQFGDQIAAGDVDGDGADEIIMADSSDRQIRIFQYNATDHTFASSNFYKDFENGDSLACGDVISGSDNKAEIIIADQSTDQISIYNESGNLLSRFHMSYDGQFHKLVAGDVNGDGMDEIIIADYEGNSVKVLYHINRETAPWEREFHRPLWPGSEVNKAGPTAAADVDGDGRDEILLTYRNNIHIVDQLGNEDENVKFRCEFFAILGEDRHATQTGEIAAGNIITGGGDEIVYVHRNTIRKVFSPLRDFSPVMVHTDEAPRALSTNPIEVDEGAPVDTRIDHYVEVVDPEGEPIYYDILTWAPDRSLAPWQDGPYEGQLTVRACDPLFNCTGIIVPLTVNNVPPSCNCRFEEGEPILMMPGGLARLLPEEHNIYITISDPGDFDRPWSISIDFGDGSSERARSNTKELVIHHPYEAGDYMVTVEVVDKDGDAGSCQFELHIVCSEDEARERNEALRSAESRTAERIMIMEQAEELKRMLEATEREKPKLPGRWGESEILQNYLDGRMAVYLNMSDNSLMILKLVLDKGSIADIDVMEKDELRDFKPSAEIHVSGETAVHILRSDDPAAALKQSFDRGEIQINGVGKANRIKYSLIVDVIKNAFKKDKPPASSR